MVAALLLAVACGKKGPPLAPLTLVPDAAGGVSARRIGSTVYLQMLAPAKNANGPGVVALDHLDVFAVTVPAGMLAPSNRDLLTASHLVGQIAIKPPPSDDEEADSESAAEDPRPAPGDRVTFVEPLAEKQLQPTPDVKFQPIPAAAAPAAAGTPAATPGTAPPSTQGAPGTEAPAPAVPSEGAAPAGAPTPTQPSPAEAEAPAAAPPAAAGAPSPPAPAQGPAAAAAALLASSSPTHPVRVYVVRGVTRKGRPGQPSARMVVPLVDPPPAPGGGSVTFSESAVTVTWIPPVTDPGATSPLTFNVYAAPPTNAAASAAQPAQPAPQPAAPAPLNPEPVAETRLEHAGAQPGVEQCFAVRTVEKVGDASLESEPSKPLCVTPKDIFPPSAPKGLAIVAMDGAVMNLIWDANTEPDLAGYVVLRGEAPGDTLQPLTPQPIHETRYTDATVKPGVRYVYAIVAVDRAEPPNRSAPSTRVEETAR